MPLWCWSDALTNILYCVLSSKSKLAVVEDMIILLPPDTEEVAIAKWLCELCDSGDIVVVSLSLSVTKNVKTAEPLVVASNTLPVWFVTIEPAALVVLNFGAVFGVILINTDADVVAKPSDNCTGNSCVSTPSPLFVTFKLAVVVACTVTSPLPLCILNLSAV